MSARLEELLARWLGDPDPKGIGTGWGSGVSAVVLGSLGLGAVLCLHYPHLLTTPSLRAIYPMAMVRHLIQLVIAAAFLTGLLSATLRRRKALAFTGMALSMAASLLGGSRVAVAGPIVEQPSLGLDWFLLNLLMLCVVFVPLERLAPLHAGQGPFRRGWVTDTAHFFVSHLLVQLTTLLTLAPSRVLFAWAVVPGLQRAVASQPWPLQFVEIVLVADLAEYGIHRLFHRLPWLWPFHEVHHSSEQLDWLAGSRLHLVDIVLTRGFTFLPIHLLGFAMGPVYAYLAFVSFHAVWIHANLRARLGWFEQLMVTPHFHHWHHSAEPEAVDHNFAVHLPWIDRLFGTYHAPAERWPRRYGTGQPPLADGYLHQLLHPFRRRASVDANDS